MHRMLVDGVTVEYRRADGSIAGAQARVIDFDTPDNNDWLAVNQFTVAEGQHTRRPDVVLFVNGLPLAVIELKNPADENATIWSAYQQLQTYQAQIPALFATNAALIVSDGVQARIGSLGAGKEWFKPWRTITGREDAPAKLAELQVVLEGVFEKRRFLDLVRYFIVFEDAGGGEAHQEDGGLPPVPRGERGGGGNAARGSRRSRSVGGDAGPLRGRAQAGRRPWRPARRRGLAHAGFRQEPDDGLLRRPRDPAPGDGEPDDRRAHRPQRPRRPALRHLRPLPRSAAPAAGAGGRPRRPARETRRSPPAASCSPRSRSSSPRRKGDRHPVLSERRNIVVIADEAHRSQYDFIDGFARHMRDALPNASFIGFTGTPIEKTDANTRAVFGDYISVYDIQRAVIDGATVPIYYESRLAKLELKESERPKIDPEFEEATEGEEVERKEKLKSQVGAARSGGRLREPDQADRPRPGRALREPARRRWTARRWSCA